MILNECDDPLMVTGELTEDEGFTMLIYQCNGCIIYALINTFLSVNCCVGRIQVGDAVWAFQTLESTKPSSTIIHESKESADSLQQMVYCPFCIQIIVGRSQIAKKNCLRNDGEAPSRPPTWRHQTTTTSQDYIMRRMTTSILFCGTCSALLKHDSNDYSAAR